MQRITMHSLSHFYIRVDMRQDDDDLDVHYKRRLVIV